MQTNCNEVVILQQGEHSSVNNSKPAGKEVTGTRKKGVTEILEKMKKTKREVIPFCLRGSFGSLPLSPLACSVGDT